MAKSSYKIPASLDTNYLDLEITIQNKDGLGLKPVSLRTLLMYLLLFFLYLMIITRTFMADAGGGIKVLFTIFWFWLGWYLIKRDKSKRSGISLISSFISYFPKHSRIVKTRRGNKLYDFAKISGISDKGVDEYGVIYYKDGSVGHGFRVVGSASVLLFEHDQAIILDRIARFYTKVDPEVEIIFDTTKEAQKVDKQVEYTKAQFAMRDIKDVPGLNKLYLEKKHYLEDYVGNRFQSIHQYMFVRAKNMEMLERFVQMFQQECSDSAMMFKRVQILGPEEIYEYFRKVKGVE